MTAIPNFGSDEDLLAGNALAMLVVVVWSGGFRSWARAKGTDGFPGFGFVAVELGSVDVAIPGFEGGLDCFHTFLKEAKAKKRGSDGEGGSVSE
jgi:hypothetical protein